MYVCIYKIYIIYIISIKYIYYIDYLFYILYRFYTYIYICSHFDVEELNYLKNWFSSVCSKTNTTFKTCKFTIIDLLCKCD